MIPIPSSVGWKGGCNCIENIVVGFLVYCRQNGDVVLPSEFLHRATHRIPPLSSDDMMDRSVGFAWECQQIMFVTTRAQPDRRELIMQDATIKIAENNLFHIWAEKGILFAKLFII